LLSLEKNEFFSREMNYQILSKIFLFLILTSFTFAANVKEILSHLEYRSILDVGFRLDVDEYEKKKIEYQGIDIEALVDLPFSDEVFDVAFAEHILEDLFSYKSALHELIRVTSHEIILIFSYPFKGEGKIHFEDFLSGHPRIESFSWESEVMLRIALQPKIKDKIKSFVVIIPSYNNESIVEMNLSSLFHQNYPYWRMVYIDDCSSDATKEKVIEQIEKWGEKKRSTFKSNEKRKGAMANLYHAIHDCLDNEIIVTLDGDDWLYDEWVLKKLNDTYVEPDVWITFGSYQLLQSGNKGEHSQPIPEEVLNNCSIRSHAWVTSHLRTFYAGLFKKIELQDLILDGDFLKMSWDQAFMIPMVEMAGKRAKYIPDILYMYNDMNPLNDHRVNLGYQFYCANYVHSLARYPNYVQKPWPCKLRKNVHAVIFSTGSKITLRKTLSSLPFGIDRVTVFCPKNLDVLKEEFPNVVFLETPFSRGAFKQMFLAHLFEEETTCSYLLFLTDQAPFRQDLNLSEAIRQLEKTHANGFYFSYKAQNEMIEMGKNVFAWSFDHKKTEWGLPSPIEMALYRKEKIETDLRKMNYRDPRTLEQQWRNSFYRRGTGLCLRGC